MGNKNNIVAVNALIKNNDGKVLILKRSENEKAYPGLWAYPGGKMEEKETIYEALKRESLEEVGIDIENDYKKYVTDFNFTRPDGINVVGLVFEVKALTEEVELGEEFDDYAWIGKEDMDNYDLIPNVRKELEILFSN